MKMGESAWLLSFINVTVVFCGLVFTVSWPAHAPGIEQRLKQVIQWNSSIVDSLGTILCREVPSFQEPLYLGQLWDLVKKCLI